MSAVKQQNLDEQEIAKFAELASRWWDLEGEFKPLHQINPLRLEFIMDAAEGLFDKKVLDVGCGGGILSESMAKAGASVTGIDMAEASLQVAKLHGLESGVSVDYQCITAESLAARQPKQYDLVTCLEMLEHVPDPASVVKACSKLVKDDGLVAFSTLNRNIKSFAMAIVAAEYIMGLVPKGTHDHKKFIKPSELLRFTDQAGLKPIAMTGLHYQPLTGEYFLSDKNVDVNYIVICKKL